jgi:serine/threonine protein kinase
MLTGKHPFRHVNATRTTSNIVSLQLNESELPSHVPPVLKGIVLRMLSKDAHERPSAEELLPQLQIAMEGLPRNLAPHLGQFVLHIRKPESVPPPHNLRTKGSFRPQWQMIAAGCTAGFLLGLLLGKLA